MSKIIWSGLAGFVVGSTIVGTLWFVDRTLRPVSPSPPEKVIAQARQVEPSKAPKADAAPSATVGSPMAVKIEDSPPQPKPPESLGAKAQQPVVATRPAREVIAVPFGKRVTVDEWMIEVDRVAVTDRSVDTASGDKLLVKLLVRNQSKTKKRVFGSYPTFKSVTAIDDLGNDYLCLNNDRDKYPIEVKESNQWEYDVYPEGFTRIPIILQVPVKAASSLTVNLRRDGDDPPFDLSVTLPASAWRD
jgi:hypothetical protein